MADPIRTFRHFREVPDSLWRWPNFSPAEIACRGTGQLELHPAALSGRRPIPHAHHSKEKRHVRPHPQLPPFP